MNKIKLKELIKELLKENTTTVEPATKPTTKPAEPTTKPGKRNPLTPPKVAPKTKPKALAEREQEVIDKIMGRFKGLKQDFNLKEYLSSNKLIKESLEPFDEFITGMFDSSIPEDVEDGDLWEDIWEDREYGDEEAYGEAAEEWEALKSHLKSVGGKDTLEGNPNIDLELLPNGDIKVKAIVTLD